MDLRVEEMERRLHAAAHDAQVGPSNELLARTKELASHALVAHCSHAREVRRWVFRVLTVMTVTLPIPVLFLWVDWSIARTLLGSLLPAHASVAASAVYLWMKVSLVGFLYATLIPLLVWLAISVRVARPSQALISGGDE